VYFGGANVLARARKDGSSASIEVIAWHSAMSGVAVDDVAIYYVTDNDNGENGTGSFWRVTK
jgi:hypothetical protein